MNTIFILPLIFVLLLTLVLIPTIIKVIGAQKQGANISFTKGIFMSLRKTFKRDLIAASALSEKLNLGIRIDYLEAHLLAGGSPLKCIQAIEYASRKGIELDFKIVSAANLSGKDLMNAIEKSNEIVELEFTETRIRNAQFKLIDYRYFGSFKTTFTGVCFGIKDEVKIISEIRSKINMLIENADTSEATVLEKIIAQSILDAKFWESNGLSLIEQRIVTK